MSLSISPLRMKTLIRIGLSQESLSTMRIIAAWLGWTISWLLLILATWVIAWYAIHLVIIPWLLARFTGIRAAEISLLSGRAVEWRPATGTTDVVPKIRVEKYGWSWGGAKAEDAGFVVFKIEGICFRIEKADQKYKKERSPRVRLIDSFDR
jgi:hypothetical protein